MDEYYSITELTREFEVTTRTLRFYEDEGLLEPVRRGRTRLYRPLDRRILISILRAKRLGFSLAQIKLGISVTQALPEGAAGIREMMDDIDARREELMSKRRDISDAMRELEDAEEECLMRLAELGAHR